MRFSPSLLYILQKLAEILGLGLLARLDSVFKFGVGTEIHQLTLEAQPRDPFARGAAVVNAAHAAGVGDIGLVTLDAADLRAVDIPRVFAHFSGGVLRRAVGAHADVGIGQRVGGLVNDRAAVASAFP